MAETLEKTKHLKKNFLEKRIVKIKPTPAGDRWATLTNDRLDPRFPFQHDGTKRSLPLPSSKQNNMLFVKVLDDITEYDTPKGVMTEKEFFEKEFGVDLTFTKTNSFWANFKLHLPKSGVDLDLTDPTHYLQYKLALVCKRYIAPSKDAINNRSTYWFYLEDADAYVDEEITKMKLQDEANEKWVEVKNNENKLRDILRVSGKKIPASVKDGFYQAEVSKLKNEKPQEFLNIINDPYFKAKSFVKNAISKGLITRQGNNGFMIVGNDIDIFKTESDLIEYLEDPENSVTRTRIENQLDRAK